VIHLGDITKIKGDNIPPVDVITFGSPCQDLSIAGKRAGLSGERSGLFMEAVRIIKEMREATNGEYPKYAVWENVPGAFSSNKGDDFRAVLEELARIKEAGISIPRPDKSKWAKAGLITGDDWSIAWRAMDAQYWGVPQRRLRISLVLDLTGGRAGEVLFEPESLRGHFAPGVTPGQATAGAVENGAGTADCTDAIPVNLQIATRHKSLGERTGLGVGQAGDAAYTLQEGHEHGVCCPDIAKAYTLKIRSGCEGGGKGALVQTEKSATLSTLQDQTLFVAEQPKAYSFDSLASNSMKSSNPHSGCREVEIAKTLDASPPDPAKNQGGIAIVEPTFCIQGNTIDRADTAGANGAGVKEDVCYTLNTIDRPAVAFALDCRNMTANEELSATLQAKGNGGQSLNYINPVAEPLIYDVRGNGDGKTSPTITGDHNRSITDYTSVIIEKIIRWIVRRLTPTECERLQGYPYGWTDLGEWVDSKGKAHKAADTPRYKALGNSIALPQWYYVLGGIADRLPDNATLGSLFDGIGGFPYVWTQLHSGRKELCVWASEIEEFPIAVTKKWFAGE
jgi:DNA (cytosine-5)-methyltransferase 1